MKDNSDKSMEFKMGQLEARMEQVEEDIKGIKKSTADISNALTKGKGIFIGLIIAASSVGALASKVFNRFME